MGTAVEGIAPEIIELIYLFLERIRVDHYGPHEIFHLQRRLEEDPKIVFKLFGVRSLVHRISKEIDSEINRIRQLRAAVDKVYRLLE